MRPCDSTQDEIPSTPPGAASPSAQTTAKPYKAQTRAGIFLTPRYPSIKLGNCALSKDGVESAHRPGGPFKNWRYILKGHSVPRVSCVLVLVLAASGRTDAGGPPPPVTLTGTDVLNPVLNPRPAGSEPVLKAYANLPLAFVENRGQTDT